MRGILWLRYTLAICVIAAVMASPGVAYNASMQWDGGPVVTVGRQANPDYNPNGVLEYRYEYYFDFSNLTLDYPQVLHANGWGGSFTDEFGDPIRVRIKQVIKNVGTEWWNDFHIVVGGDGYTYKKWFELPIGWGISQDLDRFDYYADPGAEIGPNGSFFDGIVLDVIPDSQGNGRFELWKRATVPEPATFVGLFTGLVALGAGMRYRKIRK